MIWLRPVAAPNPGVEYIMFVGCGEENPPFRMDAVTTERVSQTNDSLSIFSMLLNGEEDSDTLIIAGRRENEDLAQILASLKRLLSRRRRVVPRYMDQDLFGWKRQINLRGQENAQCAQLVS